MVHLTRRRCRDEETGAIAVIVAISAVMIFILAALVVDLGLARDTKRQAQNGADAAALAAGNALYAGIFTSPLVPKFDEAVQAAKKFAADNYGVTDAEWATCTDPQPLPYSRPGAPACISFEHQADNVHPLVNDPALDATRPDTVRVLIPTREVETTLGALAGVYAVPIAAPAAARVEFEQEPPCALCIIGPGPHDLQNGGITVDGGNIHFNGTVKVLDQGLVSTDGVITVEQTAQGPLSSYDPDPVVGAPAVPDPLGLMTMPDTTGLMPRTDPCSPNSAVGGPGIYGSEDLRNKTCTLLPGLYVIAGSSSVWNLAGNSSTHLTGTGVTLYFTCGTSSVPAPCAPGAFGATLDASGSGKISIQAPTSGPLKGLAIVFDRNNRSTMRWTGDGSGGFQGTVYAPSGSIRMNGNGCTAYNALIVVSTIVMAGNPTCLESSYGGGPMVDLPPSDLHLTQ